jgi:acyl carrier protein
MIEETGQPIKNEAQLVTTEPTETTTLDSELKSIIADVLGIEAEQADALDSDSGLFGHLPELDSMAVAGLLTEIEDRLDIVIEDEDVDGEMLETYGGLLAFVEAKVSEG